jgi:hypothetical protein
MVLPPGFVAPHDPQPSLPGMVSVSLDLKGRLLEFRAVPIRQNDSQALLPNPAWKMLFEEAGLERNNFMEVVSDWEPPVPFDKRIAWREVHANQADVLIRAEAAACQDQLVYFQIIHPWTEARKGPDGESPAPP